MRMSNFPNRANSCDSKHSIIPHKEQLVTLKKYSKWTICSVYHEPPKPWTIIKGFGHLNTGLFTKKTSKHVGLGGPWYPNNRPLPHRTLILPDWPFTAVMQSKGFSALSGLSCTVGSVMLRSNKEEKFWDLPKNRNMESSPILEVKIHGKYNILIPEITT